MLPIQTLPPLRTDERGSLNFEVEWMAFRTHSSHRDPFGRIPPYSSRKTPLKKRRDSLTPLPCDRSVFPVHRSLSDNLRKRYGASSFRSSYFLSHDLVSMRPQMQQASASRLRRTGSWWTLFMRRCSGAAGSFGPINHQKVRIKISNNEMLSDVYMNE